MGTKRSSWTVGTLQVSDQNVPESNYQRRDRPGRDPSPRIGAKARGEREKEWNREEEWRREKEMERVRGRKWDGEREMGQSHWDKERSRHRDRDVATVPRGREGERESRFREVRREGMNGKANAAEGRPEWREREREREREKGGTFPRMRKTSRERDVRARGGTEREAERGILKRLERQRGLEMEDGEGDRRTKRGLERDAERDMQRYREMERDRPREHKWNGGDKREKDRDRWRERLEYDSRKERRREEWEGKELRSEKGRDMDRETSKQRPRESEGAFSVPQRKRNPDKERDNFSDREGWEEKRKEWRKEGWRDTKSEGDSDEGRVKRYGKESEKIKLRHKHSKSEGDDEGEKMRERLREKERRRELERCREREREKGTDKYREREMEREVMRPRERERLKEREAEREAARHRDKVRHWGDERETERGRDRGVEKEKGERDMDRRRDREWERQEEQGRHSRTQGETEKRREEPHAHKARERVACTEGERVREKDRYLDREEEGRNRSFEEKRRVREIEKENAGESERGQGSSSQIKPWSSEELRAESGEESIQKEKVPEIDSITGSNREGEWTTGRFKDGEAERVGRPQTDSESDRGKEVPQHRHRPRKMWLEPRKVTDKTDVQKCTERERYTDRYSDRYFQSSIQEELPRQRRQEDRCVERGEVEAVEQEEEEQGVSVDSDGESERYKQSGTHLNRYGETESLSEGESEQSWQGDGDRDPEKETVTDSAEDSDREVERGSSSNDMYPESDGDSQREEGRERERVLSGEDGFITVSSGGEEEGDEEEFEDCKEFWDGEVAPDAKEHSEFQKDARQVETGGARETISGKNLDRKGEDKINGMSEEMGDGEGKEIENQEASPVMAREEENMDTNTGGETIMDTQEEETENGEETCSRVTVFCVIGQTLPRTRGKQEGLLDQEKLEAPSQNLGCDIGVSAEITDVLANRGQTAASRDREWEDRCQNVETEQLDKQKETEDEGEESSGDYPGIIEIQTERNEPEESIREEVVDSWPSDSERKHSGHVMTTNNERENETCPAKQDAKKETEQYSQITECRGERESGGRIGTESSTTHGQDYNREIQPIIPKPDDLRKAEERRKEDTAPYIKWARDVVREILGSSEDNTLEGSQSQSNRGVNPGVRQAVESQAGQLADAEKQSPIYATVQKNPSAQTFTDKPTDSERDEPLYAQVQKKRGRHSDASTGSEVETDRQGDLKSYANTRIQIQTDSEAGGDTRAMTRQGEEDGEEGHPDSCLSLEKISLSKSNSCPSPVKNPCQSIIQPDLPPEGQEGWEKERLGGEIESMGSFRDQGNEARSRRRGFRKTERSKEEESEEGEGRDRRTRIFNVSEDDDELSFSWSEVDLRNVTDSIERTKKKRSSKFFNSQLYQQYCEVALDREILRQSRSDTLSLCEELKTHRSTSPTPSPPPARRPLPPLPPVPHPHSLSHTNSFSSTSAQTLPLPPLPRPSSPRLSVSLTQSQTLWQDLPGVRNSQELTELGEDERRLQEVRFEVVTSEASYCRSLEIVVEHFVKSNELGTLLTAQDRNWLFSRLGDVRAISHSFLSKLEERVESDMMHFSVCDIIVRHCPRFKLVYVPYLTNQSYQDKTYQRLMDECPGFRRVVEKLEKNPICQRLPLRSFLILPFQRITRLKLLVQNIVKRTNPNTEEEAQAIKALKLLEKLIQESNDSITQMKSIESLVCLSAKVDFECKTLPLVSQSRRLVREGAVTELRGRFTVVDHAPVSEVRVENCRVKLHSLQKNLFRLHLSNKALLLRTDTQSDKLRWMSALSRPHPQIDYTTAQDITQVQCIRAFVAQQPDELNLEKADVLLVHQQSSDGWIEGTRLSDRQRGWAPESHLETIVSARTRQRNLLDTHKITTITATY
ncbi:hypothetical protein JZ751_009466 [Albula glossodonta]|uniref:Rho guanine nucleotide exchange factor 5 n=1 Tax=Albula glossodonta TaxID=121402 RepID=A0A8T2NZL1_9TELE|nr:hypothetical protein JZ751_009466 [Albula glossodonta]